MNVAVIGGSGLVGQNIVDRLRNTGHTVTGTHRTTAAKTTTVQLEKTDAQAVSSFVQGFDCVIDTAAFHDVDACERKRQTAFDVNAAGTRYVAGAAADAEAQYVYLSTDYVYAGDPAETPYTEDDPVAPLNYYARTKYAGEQAARVSSRATILRSSVIYGLARENFVTWMLDELSSGNAVDIVDDQVSSPTYAPDLADACLSVIENERTGLYNAAGPVSLSRYEFALQLAREFGFDTDLVRPTTTDELGQRAPRPRDSTLDSTRLYDELDARFTSPEDAIADIRFAWDDDG